VTKTGIVSLVLGLAATTAMAQSPCFDFNLGTPIVNGDDVVSALQPIGFAFPFGGTTYTDFYASTNGVIYLRNGAAATTPSALCCSGSITTALANTVGPLVCPFWTDLNLTVANNANVFVNSTAAVTTITWYNAIEYGDASNSKFHAQLKLFVSGQIDFSYTTNVTMRTTGDCLVGTVLNGGTDPGVSDLSAGGTTPNDTLYQLFNNAGLTFDLAGQLLSFLPTVPGYVYVPTPCPQAVPPAFNTNYGLGCVQSFNSFYELFGTSGAFDLTGTSMTMLNIGTGYLALTGTATYFAPTGAATALVLGDDAEVTVPLTTPFPVGGGTTSGLTVCSNGFVSVATGNLTPYSPVATTFLGWPQTAFAGNWHDYNPSIAGSGPVRFEEAGGFVYITWDGVYSYATTAPDTWQLQFDTASGNVNFVWVTASTQGNARLVGYSPGGASQNPGSTDLSIQLPLTITVSNGPELIPLGIAATGVASPGATVTLDATNIPVGSPFGAVLFGLLKFNPGLPIPGMPGCFQYNEGAATSLFIAPATGVPFTAPTGTTFLGVLIQAQAAVFAPGATPLGVIASGGVEILLGT